MILGREGRAGRLGRPLKANDIAASLSWRRGALTPRPAQVVADFNIGDGVGMETDAHP
jgi:hypothetical protein